jgi:hypothetical protein
MAQDCDADAFGQPHFSQKTREMGHPVLQFCLILAAELSG